MAAPKDIKSADKPAEEKKPPVSTPQNGENGGRTGKYTDEVVERILYAVSKTGLEIEGAKAGGIAPSTLSEWKTRHPEINAKLARAREEYRATLWREDPALVLEARKGLMRLVQGVKTTHTKTKVTELPSGTKTVTFETVIEHPPNLAAIDRVLGIERGKNGDDGAGGASDDLKTIAAAVEALEAASDSTTADN